MPIEKPAIPSLKRRVFKRVCRYVGIEIEDGFVPLSKKFPKYKIGRWSYGDPMIVSYGDGTELEIGSFCSISSRVTILLGGEHRPDWVTTYPFNMFWPNAPRVQGNPKSKGDVLVGHDVWIGYGTTILSGVSIGTGAVVGAHSLVTHNVPPYAIVAGNPARLIRYRFDESVIKRLLGSQWWKLQDVVLEKYLPLLLSARVDDFLSAIEREVVVP